jgi:hypothetical protein
MVDRFLREVQRMHQLRQDINEMTPEEADELIRGLGDDAAEDWIFAARDAQLPPPDLSWCWLFLGGRGAGKSHSMSAAVHTAVRAGIKRIHFISPTTTDFHDVNIEGKSGIFATCGRDPRPRWVASRRRLERQRWMREQGMFDVFLRDIATPAPSLLPRARSVSVRPSARSGTSARSSWPRSSLRGLRRAVRARAADRAWSRDASRGELYSSDTPRNHISAATRCR